MTSGGNSRHLFVVVNPHAGNHTRSYLIARLHDSLGPTGIDYHIHSVSNGENIGRSVRQAIAGGFNEIIAVGGDGTVSAVAGAVAGWNIAMGIVPTGTANMLARELGIPLTISEACALLTGKHRYNHIDAMEMNGRCFVYQIVMGLASDAVSKITRDEKRIFGRSAYLLAGFRLLTEYQPMVLQAYIDGRMTRVWASQVMIVNAGIMGVQPFRLGPGIRPDDGKVEIVIMRGRSLFSFLGSGVDLLVGNYHYSHGLRYLEAHRTIDVSTEPEMLVKADGEFIGWTPVSVRVRPHAVKFIVPEEKM